MAQDLNTPMRLAEEFDGREGSDMPLPVGDTDEDFIARVNAAEALPSKPVPPTMDFVDDLEVTLPVPIPHPTLGDLRVATVRELTGEDEEYLAKGRDSHSKISRLVERGTVNIGGEDVDLAFVESLVIGNRDTLMVAIRRATYGDELELDLICNACKTENEIIIDLSTELEYVGGEDTATVELRRGGTALIRWPNVSDQTAIQLAAEKNRKMTSAEVNSMLLGRILLEVNGHAAVGETTARGLRMPDRRDIVNFVEKNQPGPAFDKIEHECRECGRTSAVMFGYDELFR